MTQKNPVIAALLSVIPGWGQWYNEKNILKSFIFLIVIFTLNFFGITILALLVWLIGIIEAYMTAGKINRNEISFVELSTLQIILWPVVAFAAVFLLSALYYIFFGAGMFTN
jgi:hypothetical protein